MLKRIVKTTTSMIVGYFLGIYIVDKLQTKPDLTLKQESAL